MKFGMDVMARLEKAGARRFAERIAGEHGLDLADVLVRRRRMARVCRARDEIVAVITDTLGLSLPEAGELFGMDHTSVLMLKRRRALFFNPGMNKCAGEERHSTVRVRGDLSRERAREQGR